MRGRRLAPPSVGQEIENGSTNDRTGGKAGRALRRPFAARAAVGSPRTARPAVLAPQAASAVIGKPKLRHNAARFARPHLGRIGGLLLRAAGKAKTKRHRSHEGAGAATFKTRNRASSAVHTLLRTAISQSAGVLEERFAGFSQLSRVFLSPRRRSSRPLGPRS